MSSQHPDDFEDAIYQAGLDIYSPLEVGDSNLIPIRDLETKLNQALRNMSLAGKPVRTRSKDVKAAVCKAMGYAVPASFKRTQPRFPAQQLDVYVQRSMNLQIWNEGLAANRRYAIIQVSPQDRITKVRVVTGQDLEKLDTTGTVTRKYQAGIELGQATSELVSVSDTSALLPHVAAQPKIAPSASPSDEPASGSLIAINTVYNRLSQLVGSTFADPGAVQERSRGAALQELVCKQLGYLRYDDNGQFPDVRHQLLEVKLQTSPTIDLGVALPSSFDKLAVAPLGDHQPRFCDARYAVFYGQTDGKTVQLTHLFVVTGMDFFTRFRRFEGNGVNKKIQIRLPADFFN